MQVEIPSDAEVLAVLKTLGERVSARALCDALVDRDHPRDRSQLAIQRAAERGKIAINDDLTLSPVEAAELEAA